MKALAFGIALAASAGIGGGCYSLATRGGPPRDGHGRGQAVPRSRPAPVSRSAWESAQGGAKPGPRDALPVRDPLPAIAGAEAGLASRQAFDLMKLADLREKARKEPETYVQLKNRLGLTDWQASGLRRLLDEESGWLTRRVQEAAAKEGIRFREGRQGGRAAFEAADKAVRSSRDALDVFAEGYESLALTGQQLKEIRNVRAAFSCKVDGNGGLEVRVGRFKD